MLSRISRLLNLSLLGKKCEDYRATLFIAGIFGAFFMIFKAFHYTELLFLRLYTVDFCYLKHARERKNCSREPLINKWERSFVLVRQIGGFEIDGFTAHGV